MPVNLSNAASEGSTYIVTARFTDADGTAVTPESVHWTLTDLEGAIINSRERVEATPAAIMNIVMAGDDLLFEDGEKRVLLIEAIYDSAKYGTDLPLNEEVRFSIVDLLKVQRDV